MPGMVMKPHSRRSFIARARDLAALTLLAGSVPRAGLADPLGIPVGIQLYSVNEPMRTDPQGTLKKLRRIGYRLVETAGFGTRSAGEFRRLLEEAGLQCPSAHLDLSGPDLGAVFAAAQALGATYVVSSILRPGSGALSAPDPEGKHAPVRAMTLEDARRTAELANRIGAQARQAGLRYCYHNHFMEFAAPEHGEVAYDVLVRETDPELVGFEIDCGWMRVAGADPVHYFRKYPQRFPMIHVKDFTDVGAAAVAPGLRAGTELGHGFIDYRPIFAAARSRGLKYYFVEQEAPFTDMSALDAAQANYDYLHAMK